MKKMVLKNHEKNPWLNFAFPRNASYFVFKVFSKPWFFKVIIRKNHEFSENRGFEKPWFFGS
jgi:hypothetical protein